MERRKIRMTFIFDILDRTDATVRSSREGAVLMDGFAPDDAIINAMDTINKLDVFTEPCTITATIDEMSMGILNSLYRSACKDTTKHLQAGDRMIVHPPNDTSIIHCCIFKHDDICGFKFNEKTNQVIKL